MSITNENMEQAVDAVRRGKAIADLFDPVMETAISRFGLGDIASFFLGRAGMLCKMAGHDVAATYRMMADFEEGKKVNFEGYGVLDPAEVHANVQAAVAQIEGKEDE